MRRALLELRIRWWDFVCVGGGVVQDHARRRWGRAYRELHPEAE